MKKEKLFSLLLAACMLIGLLSACGGTSSGASTSGSASSGASADADTTSSIENSAVEATASAQPAEQTGDTADLHSSAQEGTPGESISYPIGDGSQELSMFMLFTLSNYFDSPADSVYWQAFEEATGVNVNFTLTDNESQAEKFSLMVASGDYTDLMHNFNNLYSAGLDNAVEQEIILPLNDYMDCLPDYMAAISQNDTMSKAAVTDDGNYAVVRGFYDCISYTNYGLVIRQDWLDDLNMEVPHTYDQLYDVMKAFVSEKGASYGVFVPYTGVIFGDYLVAGYGVSGFTFDATRSPFYQVDGEVKFGAIEDGMKDYLTMMHQWYDEGLVDHDFTSYTANFTYPDDSDITNEEVGIWGCITGLISAYPTWFDEGSSFQLSAMADMVKEEGDMNHFSYARDLSLGGTGIAISANCEDPELAAKFLNYNFTDEGYLLNNYGVEGVSYEYVDGKPQFTEAVTANETMPTNYALAYYAQSTNGAFIIDNHRMDSTYNDVQLGAAAIWDSVTDGAYDYPSFVTLTSSESESFSKTYSDINSYVQEMILKFIIGEESLDNWDSYVENVKAMGIDTCIEIKQDGYDRYMER